MVPTERQSGSPRETSHPDQRILAHDVCRICGGVTSMTLYRWLNNPALNFPKPIKIGHRRYWREADIVAWLDAQEVAA